MPTLACKNSLFLHIPKCAGSAMCHALGMSKIGTHNYAKDGIPHATISELKPEHQHLPRWTTIRQPAEWLRSLWCYRWQSNWPAPNIPEGHPFYQLISFRTKDFRQYVNYVLGLQAPITQFFKQYIDENTVVLRIERMDKDLDRLLKLEPEFSPKLFQKVNPTNLKVDMTDDQRFKIWKGEQEFFQQHYACYYSVE